MAHFGIAGNLTIKTDQGVVRLELSKGEYLHYRLVAQGAHPIFTLTCEHFILWDQNSFAAPLVIYERNWPQNVTEVHANEDIHTFMMSFVAADRYRLVIEHRDAAGQLLSVLKDIDCSSPEPSDSYIVSLEIYGDPIKRP
jgi:hypothetical protein